MKKIFSLIFILFFSTLSVFSADMRIIQVDGALYSKVNSTKFEKLIEKINKEKDVEFVIFTGNNIAKPDPNLLKDFIKLTKKIKAPCYFVLGQKDVNIKKNLSKNKYISILKKYARSHKKIKESNYVIAKKGIVFIIADGSKEVIPTSIGYYKENVILFLDEQLDTYKDKNVVILQHYPIVPPSVKETHYTYKAEEYLQLLSEHNNVKAVIAGHFNVNSEKKVNGILHIATKNAPTYRIIDILDYETENPTFWSTIKE